MTRKAFSRPNVAHISSHGRMVKPTKQGYQLPDCFLRTLRITRSKEKSMDSEKQITEHSGSFGCSSALLQCPDCEGGKTVGMFPKYVEGVTGPPAIVLDCDRCNVRITCSYPRSHPRIPLIGLLIRASHAARSLRINRHRRCGPAVCGVADH